MDTELLEIPVQILPNDDPSLKYDILLGADFQDKYDLKVDWKDYSLTIRTADNYKFNFKRNPGNFRAPARTESVQLVKTTGLDLGCVPVTVTELIIFK